MYLCVRGIDFISFYDFIFDIITVYNRTVSKMEVAVLSEVRLVACRIFDIFR
jgi:hypothetical protein